MEQTTGPKVDGDEGSAALAKAPRGASVVAQHPLLTSEALERLPRSFRGYDRDATLELLVTLRKHFAELLADRRRVAVELDATEQRLAAVEKEIEQRELAVGQAMVKATAAANAIVGEAAAEAARMRDQAEREVSAAVAVMRDEAVAEAQGVLRDAQADAARIVTEGEAEAQRLRQEVEAERARSREQAAAELEVLREAALAPFTQGLAVVQDETRRLEDVLLTLASRVRALGSTTVGSAGRPSKADGDDGEPAAVEAPSPPRGEQLQGNRRTSSPPP